MFKAWRICPHPFVVTLVLQAVVWGMVTTQNCLFSFLAGDPKLSAILKGTPSQPITIYTYCL